MGGKGEWESLIGQGLPFGMGSQDRREARGDSTGTWAKHGLGSKGDQAGFFSDQMS
jgi:hypothetical protein